MAMVNDYVIEEVGDSPITAIGYNSAKRQILFGYQDGSVCGWDIEEDRLVHIHGAKHAGWVTTILFLPKSKIYLTASIDGKIHVMHATQHFETIDLGLPVYSLAINYDRNHLIVGLNGGIKIYDLDESRASGSIIKKKVLQFAREHTDIVRCVTVHDGKVFTGGYDRKMIIYETSYASREVVRPLIINAQSHAAGITALLVITDSDTRTWILTGCFDKVLRIWSLEGHLVHRIDFPDVITSFCYVAKLETVWIAARSDKAYVVDLKTAENITAFVESGITYTRTDEEQFDFELTALRYVPEYMMIVGSTTRKHVVLWRYQYSACAITLHHGTPVCGLSYSNTVPNVFYAADANGDLHKWERSTANPYLYSKDLIPFNEMTYRKINKPQKQDNLESFLKYPSPSDHEDDDDDIEEVSTTYDNGLNDIDESVVSHRTEEVVIDKVSRIGLVSKMEFVDQLKMIIISSEDSNVYIWMTDEKAMQALETLSKYHESTSKKPEIVEDTNVEKSSRRSERMQLYSILLTPEYCEHQRDRSNSLFSSNRSSIIPSSAVQIAQAMQNRRQFGVPQIVTSLPIHNMSEKRTIDEDYDEEAVTRKLAGYSCRHVFAGHTSVVTSFVVIPPRKSDERSEFLGDDTRKKSYMLTCGWDARICIWDLERCVLQDVFRNTVTMTGRRAASAASTSKSPTSARRRQEAMVLDRERRELACDGVILDICYCNLRNEFAYACSDKVVYIRRFSPVGSEMVLLGMLKGHADDVTGVVWNSRTDQYVTSSEDHTVRVWSGTGLNECLHIMNTNGVAQAIALDLENGTIVVSDRSGLSVYDSDSFDLVQENRAAPTAWGRKMRNDAELEMGPVINSILHIPERKAYITASSDGNIRVYNAWIRPKRAL